MKEWYEDGEQDGAHEARKEQQHHQVFAGQLARENLECRVQRRGGKREKCGRMQDFSAWPHDQQHADKPRDDKSPAGTGEPLAQEPSGHQRNQYRRHVVERGRLRHRKKLQCREKAGARSDQQDAAHEMQRGPLRADEIPAQPGYPYREDQQRLHAPPCPDEQRYRIALTEILDCYVNGCEARTCEHDQQDGRQRNMRR
jgi:hypothetical protein